MVRDKVKKGGTIIVNPESLIDTNPDESAGFGNINYVPRESLIIPALLGRVMNAVSVWRASGCLNALQLFQYR